MRGHCEFCVVGNPLRSGPTGRSVVERSPVASAYEEDPEAMLVDRRDLGVASVSDATEQLSGHEQHYSAKASKRDNDHHELSVLANSFPCPLRLSK
jgi:hypothetical protein